MNATTMAQQAMGTRPAPASVVPAASVQRTTTLRALVGSGDRIGVCTLPFLLVGLALNARYPSRFAAGGPSTPLRAISLVAVVPGAAIWAWSVALLLTKVPQGELITSGPYALVKHPLYTSVALLVLPWAGFLCNSWLGVPFGIVLYALSRRLAPAEEAELAKTFGAAWEDYRRTVTLPWL